MQVFGIASDIPEFLDLRAHARKFRDAGIDDLVPFLKVIGDSDPYCFNSTGQIVRWRHEEPELREPESLTFSELLMREIRELEERVRRKRAGADRHPQG